MGSWEYFWGGSVNNLLVAGRAASTAAPVGGLWFLSLFSFFVFNYFYFSAEMGNQREAGEEGGGGGMAYSC